MKQIIRNAEIFLRFYYIGFAFLFDEMFYNMSKFITNISSVAKKRRRFGTRRIETNYTDTNMLLRNKIRNSSIINKDRNSMAVLSNHHCCMIAVSADTASKERRIL